MFISGTVLWYVMALILVGAELLTATFYLLVVALGCVAAGTTSYFGLALGWKLGSCALVIILGSIWVHRLRSKKDSQASERLMALDAGQRVEVSSVGTDGLAVVQYRGSPWVARSDEGELHAGLYTIDRIDGTQLVLKKVQ